METAIDAELGTAGSDPYGALFRRVMLPAWERLVRRRATLDHWAALERSQWWSLDRLRAYQVAELKRLVTHASANVPLYRARLQQAGVRPEMLREPEDLAKLPLLCREIARAAGSAWRSVAPPLPTIRKSTGGTTGAPLVFGYDLGSEHVRQAVKLRGYAWTGYRPGDRTLHFWGRPMTTTPWFTRTKMAIDRRVRREHYVDCTRADFERVIALIRAERPRVLVCYTLAGAALARYVLETQARSWDDITVICAAEKLFPADRISLAHAFGPQIFDTYGCREVMLVAAECEAHDGLHVSMENIVVEVIVREDGRERPAAPGEEGDVVITDLHNYGMPFIRYLNGDRAIMRPPGRCTCGRELVRIASVEGRSSDMLRDRLGRPVSGILFSVMFSYPPMSERVRMWRVVQHADGAVTIKLVVAPSFTLADRDKVRREAACRLGGVDVNVLIVEELLPDDNGKQRLVVVEPPAHARPSESRA